MKLSMKRSLGSLAVVVLLVILLLGTGVPIRSGALSDPPQPMSPGVAAPTVREAPGMAEAPNLPDAVLWDQPRSTVNGDVYASQDFEAAADAYDIYIGDDFTNPATWRISTVYVPGESWIPGDPIDDGCDLTNASQLVWQIYGNGAGQPNGEPHGSGTAPVWSLSLAPTDAQITLTDGVAGFQTNVALNLAAPLQLGPGTWWLVFFAVMDFEPNHCQCGRISADTTNGSDAMAINPGGGFEFGTTWTSVQSQDLWGLAQQDFAFRLEGTAVSSFSLGDKAWRDTDRDGIQDAGEAGLAGVGVTLFGNGTCTGASLGSDTTDAAGLYGFTGLEAGAYCLRFVAPAGWAFSPRDQGGDNTRDSDADPVTGQIQAINLAANDATQDVGFNPVYSLGDRVWNDADGDGLQDAEEAGRRDIKVDLYSNGTCTGTAAASQTTNAGGVYTFAGLETGTYCLHFPQIPAGWLISPQNAGGNDTIDSDVDLISKQIRNISLAATDLSQDLGIYTQQVTNPTANLPLIFMPRIVSSQLFRTGEEGTLRHPGGASISVPRGAVPQAISGGEGEMLFSIERGKPEDFGVPEAAPAGWRRIGDTYSMGPEGFIFDTPITARMPLPAEYNHATDEVAMFDYDRVNNKWESVGGQVETESDGRKVIAADALHLCANTIMARNVNGQGFGAIDFNVVDDVFFKACIESYTLKYPGWDGDFEVANRFLSVIRGHTPQTPPDGLVHWNLPQGVWTVDVGVYHFEEGESAPPVYKGYFQRTITLDWPHWDWQRNGPDWEYSVNIGEMVTNPDLLNPARPPCMASATPAVGVGAVNVRLEWNADADIDLWVIDPCGTKIYWSGTQATCQGSLGQLDQDNLCARLVRGKPENIYWAANPPHGKYEIWVDYWAECSSGAGAVDYTVRWWVNGTTNVKRGTISPSDPAIKVAEFNR